MRKKRVEKLKFIDKLTETELEYKKIKRTLFKFLTLMFLIISFFITVGLTAFVAKISADFPDVSVLSESHDQTSIIYDIKNNPIANIHGDEDRESVPLDKISPWLQKAVIATEDNRFYRHNGVDLVGTIRALYSNSSGDSMQGGSTLTQQLVKNSFLTPEKSLKRKFVEAMLAMKVERRYSKNEILEMYFNRIYWGNRCYGAQKAAKRYFKKDAIELNLAQSALLAGLLKAPEGLSPYKNFKGAKARQKDVLERMEYYGYITHRQRFDAEREPLKFAPTSQNYSKYPYFVQYVINTLTAKYGDDIVRRGGLRVYTTLDPQIQQAAEIIMTKGIKAHSSGGASQGALVSIDLKKGYIQALIGGADFNKSNFDRATQTKRAAGSSFKPVVYLTGFRLGKITPDSPILDAPVSFYTGWGYWRPHNWDGRYMGAMNVRKALTLSRNTTTVRVALKVGIDKIIETARLVGIKSHIDHNFSVVLGSLGVSPLEMATVYSTFAREGVYMEPTAIIKVEDRNGKLLESYKSTPIRVVDPKPVRSLNSILRDVVEKGTGKNAKLKNRIVCGKTGSSDNFRDLWFTGFTSDMVTSVWLGNDANLPMKGVFSSNCAEIWHNFGEEYYRIKTLKSKEVNNKPQKINSNSSGNVFGNNLNKTLDNAFGNKFEDIQGNKIVKKENSPQKTKIESNKNKRKRVKAVQKKELTNEAKVTTKVVKTTPVQLAPVPQQQTYNSPASAPVTSTDPSKKTSGSDSQYYLPSNSKPVLPYRP